MFSFKGRTIDKICVVGSGQIGPDIALYFAKVFTPYNVPIVVVDVAAEALEKGRTKVHKKIDKGAETGAFRGEVAEAMKANITFTADYDEARGASLVVEAASESRGDQIKDFFHP